MCPLEVTKEALQGSDARGQVHPSVRVAHIAFSQRRCIWLMSRWSFPGTRPDTSCAFSIGEALSKRTALPQQLCEHGALDAFIQMTFVICRSLYEHVFHGYLTEAKSL